MKGTIALLLAVASIGISAYPSERNYQRTELGNAIDKASLKLLKEAYKSSSNQNVIASPLGVLILLALYSEGAGAVSKEEIHKVLAGGDLEKGSNNHAYAYLSQEFANMDPKFLTLANKIYVQDGLTLNDDFSRISNDDYRSGVESLDFSNATAAAAIINKWSDEKTKGHIKSPVSPDAITPDTVAGLFNVIFFQGHWHVPFNASETKDEDFHVDKSTTVKKPTMHLEQSLFYTESEYLNAKMVELPYKEDGFRMVIVLPNEIDGLSSVIEKASEKGLLEDVFKLEPSGRDVQLHLPKFEIKTKLDLNDLLPKVGVSKIFTEGASGVVKNADVVVSKAFQEAFVKVDEEGATAGAFTGTLMIPMSWPPPPPPAPLEFKADHPFLFVILQRDRVLFAGTHAA